MHYIDAPDYLDKGGGVRWFKETPSPGTVVGRYIMNAVMLEIIGVILAEGITLRTGGSADETANYASQLNDAIDAKDADLEATLQAQIDTLDDWRTDEIDPYMQSHWNGFIQGFHLGKNEDEWRKLNISKGSLGIYIINADEWYNVNLTSANYYKQFIGDAYTGYETFAPGSGNGGVAPGVNSISPRRWLHVYVIWAPTKPVEIIADDSLTAANARTAYGTQYSIGDNDDIGYRRIGSFQIITLSPSVHTIKPFSQHGDKFTWHYTYNSGYTEVNTESPGEEVNLDVSAITNDYGSVAPAFPGLQVKCDILLSYIAKEASQTLADLKIEQYLEGGYVDCISLVKTLQAGEQEYSKEYVKFEAFPSDYLRLRMSVGVAANVVRVYTMVTGYTDFRGKFDRI